MNNFDNNYINFQIAKKTLILTYRDELIHGTVRSLITSSF